MNPASRPNNPASACLSCSRECRWPGRGHEQPSSTRATSPRALNPSFAPPHLPQPAPGDPYPWPTPEHTPAPCSQLSRHSATSELATSELSALSTRAVYGCPQARPAICRELPCYISFLPSRVRVSTSRSGWRRPVSNSPGPSLSRGGQQAPFLQQMVTERLLCAPGCSSAQALPGRGRPHREQQMPAASTGRTGPSLHVGVLVCTKASQSRMRGPRERGVVQHWRPKRVCFTAEAAGARGQHEVMGAHEGGRPALPGGEGRARELAGPEGQTGARGGTWGGPWGPEGLGARGQSAVSPERRERGRPPRNSGGSAPLRGAGAGAGLSVQQAPGVQAAPAPAGGRLGCVGTPFLPTAKHPTWRWSAVSRVVICLTFNSETISNSQEKTREQSTNSPVFSTAMT